MKGFNTGIVYCIGKKKCGERYEKRKIRLDWSNYCHLCSCEIFS